jgi:CxxC motif-containing protein (DUF1111 family)
MYCFILISEKSEHFRRPCRKQAATCLPDGGKEAILSSNAEDTVMGNVLFYTRL